MTKINSSKEVSKISNLLENSFPALNYVIWDLGIFMPYLHNWRKNIIFLECEKPSIETIAEKLGNEFTNYDILFGEKKPLQTIRTGKSKGSIVIIARENSGNKREVDINQPTIEKCLVDLLHYSKNEILSISLTDVIELWKFYLDESRGNPKFINGLYRYASRRYLGWFVNILLYHLSIKNSLAIDKRHILSGKKNLELIRLVERIE